MSATHDELRALAAAATPGPWDSEYVWQAVRHIVRNCDFVQGADEFSDGDGFGWNYGPRGEKDPAYIAAVSPDVVVALLDEIAELRAAHAQAVDELRLWGAATVTQADEGHGRKTPQQVRSENAAAVADGVHLGGAA